MTDSSGTVQSGMDINPGDTFNIGSKVKKSGMYICAPCGDKKRFRENQEFPNCFSCLEGKVYNEDVYIKDLGLWEFIKE